MLTANRGAVNLCPANEQPGCLDTLALLPISLPFGSLNYQSAPLQQLSSSLALSRQTCQPLSWTRICLLTAYPLV
jgi:hypothetical protein